MSKCGLTYILEFNKNVHVNLTTKHNNDNGILSEFILSTFSILKFILKCTKFLKSTIIGK